MCNFLTPLELLGIASMRMVRQILLEVAVDGLLEQKSTHGVRRLENTQESVLSKTMKEYCIDISYWTMCLWSPRMGRILASVMNLLSTALVRRDGFLTTTPGVVCR